MNGAGTSGGRLSPDVIADTVARACAAFKPDGRRILLLIPDHTRTCPLDQLFPLIYDALAPRARQFDVLVALGTHPPMPLEQIYRRVGLTPETHARHFPRVRFFNHCWDDPAELTSVGRFSAGDVRTLTDGRLALDIEVTCNRMVRDYDLLLICGPVFPHEVVGFSGGNKYLFPGISGPDVLTFFHWQGALLTIPDIIGRAMTPVRETIDRAAAMIPVERRALCMVTDGPDGLAGLFHGTPEEAWREAAALSARRHITYTGRTYPTVFSDCPEMYDELWVAAKCAYKMEPVVAEGGRIIIYAPHLREISVTHGRLIREVGYHVRDYFVKQWDRFRHHPWGVLAHSTHVRGGGTWADGVERPHHEVVLASQISEAECRAINLGWMDPAAVDPAAFQGRDDTLYVPHAGERLFRVAPESR